LIQAKYKQSICKKSEEARKLKLKQVAAAWR